MSEIINSIEKLGGGTSSKTLEVIYTGDLTISGHTSFTSLCSKDPTTFDYLMVTVKDSRYAWLYVAFFKMTKGSELLFPLYGGSPTLEINWSAFDPPKFVALNMASSQSLIVKEIVGIKI